MIISIFYFFILRSHFHRPQVFESAFVQMEFFTEACSFQAIQEVVKYMKIAFIATFVVDRNKKYFYRFPLLQAMESFHMQNSLHSLMDYTRLFQQIYCESSSCDFPCSGESHFHVFSKARGIVVQLCGCISKGFHNWAHFKNFCFQVPIRCLVCKNSM